jgi:hypothetical protein
MHEKSRLALDSQRPEERNHEPDSKAPAVACYGDCACGLMVALGGVAFAAIPDSNGKIHGCYQTNNGNLRVVESPSQCRSSESALSWNQEGPPGEASGLQRLGQQVLVDGERRVLFSVGPLTFTAVCNENTPENQHRPLVYVTTSEDHAAVHSEASASGRADFNVGDAVRLSGLPASTTSASFRDIDFGAMARDGTTASGILTLGETLSPSRASACSGDITPSTADLEPAEQLSTTFAGRLETSLWARWTQSSTSSATASRTHS